MPYQNRNLGLNDFDMTGFKIICGWIKKKRHHDLHRNNAPKYWTFDTSNFQIIKFSDQATVVSSFFVLRFPPVSTILRALRYSL